MTRTSLKRSLLAAEQPILLETSTQLQEAEQSWDGNKVLGIDTEFVRERTYRAELGLVQVSDGATAWLVDPVKLDSLEPLQRLLSNPEIIKILHSGSEDLEVLLNTVGALPDPLVDTQVACAMLGQPLQMGYHTTVQWLFDIEVDKEQTRSNWCRRPLTERQLHYAAMDVVLLPEMYEILKARLEEKGRWTWLEEEAARAQQNAQRTIEPELAYLRVSGAQRLDEEDLRVLRSLAAWREDTAKEKKPCPRLCDFRRRADGTGTRQAGLCAGGSQSRRHPPQGFGPLRGNTGPLIAAAQDDRSPLTGLEPLNGPQRKQLAAMRKLVQQKTEELEIEPALLASRRELERLIQTLAEGKDIPERFTGWRKAAITDDLLAITP